MTLLRLLWMYFRAPWQLREMARHTAYMTLVQFGDGPHELPVFPDCWEVTGFVSDRGYEGGTFGRPYHGSDCAPYLTAGTYGSSASATVTVHPRHGGAA
jgi:hypothetical protein